MTNKLNDKCSICNADIVGWGHNPQPVKNKDGQQLKVEDRCCYDCNISIVVPERMKQFNSRRAQ